MNLTGRYYERLALLTTKYGYEIEDSSIQNNASRLTNQLWKLIPMRENEEDWIKQLDTVLIEISGLGEIFHSEPLFLQMLDKLEGLRQQNDISFMLYRKTVFEVIGLLQNVAKNR